MRYIVLDTGDDEDAVLVNGCRCGLLGSFPREEDATALALRRMSSGDIGVVVIDVVTVSRVFPAHDEDGKLPGSGVRLRRIFREAGVVAWHWNRSG